MQYRKVAALLIAAAGAQAGDWDPAVKSAAWISSHTENRIKLIFEQRGRYEHRTAQSFGAAPDIDNGLLRTRVGLIVKPLSWMTMTATGQDSRAPWWGPNAPTSVRDEFDLLESAIDLSGGPKDGFGVSFGRKMLKYGDSRLIGSPQWGNLARSFDYASVGYRHAKARFEVLVASPVKIRAGEFNRPALGDRVWGMYHTFQDVRPKAEFDVYLLRHDQNRPGGFTGGRQADGTDRLGTTSYGARYASPWLPGMKYVLEAVVQTGRVGAANHRAAAWVATLNRRWQVDGRNLDVSAEYKYASGTGNPGDAKRVSTFDQIFAANHDRFGHADLFGWRNVHSARGLATYAITRSVALNCLYDELWLASPRDALYSGAGKAIARSADGSAGRHVGGEADVFFTLKYAHFQFGGGYGHLFAGAFLRRATPGASPSYAYLFHSYSF